MCLELCNCLAVFGLSLVKTTQTALGILKYTPSMYAKWINEVCNLLLLIQISCCPNTILFKVGDGDNVPALGTWLL